MKRTSCLVAFFLLFAANLQAQTSRNVLFIGNSYTDVNNLPQMVADIAQSMGDQLTFGKNTPGGCTFQQHCTNASMQLICNGGWDAVVLQEQSQYPSFPQSQVEAEVFPYAKRLVDSVYANNPCAEPMFYQTWGRKNGDQQNAQYFPVLGTYEGMDSMLTVRYQYMAEANDASLCPVGRVWRYLRENCPYVELYQSDESHPSLAGTYAAACSFYVMLFHRNPNTIQYNASLDDAIASTIRSAVAIVVYDSIERWQRPQPQASFVVDTVEGQSVRFVSYATHAASAEWFFGDGETLTTMDAYVTHEYSDTGTYQVMQVAMRHCISDTFTLNIHVTPTGDTSDTLAIDEAGLFNSISLYPNPTVQSVILNLPDLMQGVYVELVSLDGRLLWSSYADNSSLQIPVKGVSSGVYLLRISDSRRTFVKKIVKQ